MLTTLLPAGGRVVIDGPKATIAYPTPDAATVVRAFLREHGGEVRLSASRYFLRHWMPVLGPEWTVLILALQTIAEETGSATVRLQRLADASGLHAKTLQRMLAEYRAAQPRGLKWLAIRTYLHRIEQAAQSTGPGRPPLTFSVLMEDVPHPMHRRELDAMVLAAAEGGLQAAFDLPPGGERRRQRTPERCPSPSARAIGDKLSSNTPDPPSNYGQIVPNSRLVTRKARLITRMPRLKTREHSAQKAQTVAPRLASNENPLEFASALERRRRLSAELSSPLEKLSHAPDNPSHEVLNLSTLEGAGDGALPYPVDRQPEEGWTAAAAASLRGVHCPPDLLREMTRTPDAAFWALQWTEWVRCANAREPALFIACRVRGALSGDPKDQCGPARWYREREHQRRADYRTVNPTPAKLVKQESAAPAAKQQADVPLEARPFWDALVSALPNAMLRAYLPDAARLSHEPDGPTLLLIYPKATDLRREKLEAKAGKVLKALEARDGFPRIRLTGPEGAGK